MRLYSAGMSCGRRSKCSSNARSRSFAFSSSVLAGPAPRGALDAAFRRRAVLEDPVQRLVREVQAPSVLLQLLGGAHALLVVPEAFGKELGEHLFTDVPEGRMTDVVAQRHGLDEVL